MRTDYNLHLDPAGLASGKGFFRASGEQLGEAPLAATYAAANSGIVGNAGVYGIDDPVTAWSGGQLPASSIGVQIQTALTAIADVEITRVVYVGFLWSDRAIGTTTTVSADLVAWRNGVLESPGIVSPRRTLAAGAGGTLLTPFTTTYPVVGAPLAAGDTRDLRLRLQDANGTAFTLSEEAFGIDTITVFGKPSL